MKTIFNRSMLLIIINLTHVVNAIAQQPINTNYSKAFEIQTVLDELVKTGIPGSSIAIYSKEGWWTTSTGFSKIESKTVMTSDHLQFLQSVAKTYMAICVMKLYEEGKLQLDAPISNYLPAQYAQHLNGVNEVTVRMLLNHTSGLPEYNSQPAYVSKLLQHPEYLFSPEEYLRYIDKKELDFKPGNKYSYRNTNYLVLALIVDQIAGDHRKFLNETIIKPLGLTSTFYAGSPGFADYPNLVDSYWDRHSDGIIENFSLPQRNNVKALIGDDGVVATPVEAVKFLRALMEGKLISSSSLELMKTWQNDGKGQPTYGLGIDYGLFNGHPGYGHSGGGLGAGCQLYYLPEPDVYFFIAINLGTVTESPLHESVGKALDRIYKILSE